MTKYPSIVYLRLLQECNARCVMCDSYKQSREHADLNYIKGLIDEFDALGVSEVRFTGGEAFIYKPIRKLLSYITDKRPNFSFITNGAYVTKFCDEIVESKVGKIVCSVDSPYAEIHNSVRKTRNLLENASAGIKLIQRRSYEKNKSLKFVVNSVVSSSNYYHLRDFLPFLQDHNVNYWNLIPIHGEQPINMTQAHIDVAMKEIDFILNKIERLNLPLDLNINDPKDFFATAVHGTKPAELTHGVNQCHVLNHVAFIDAVNGKLTGCNDLMYSGFDEVIATKIHGKTFEQVWCDPDYQAIRKDFTCKALNKCDRCEPTNIKLNTHLHKVGPDSQINIPTWF